MKTMKLLIATLVICSTLISIPVTQGTEHKPPNIVLIFTDYLGWKDTGYQGGAGFETPNIDQLASEGMVFTNAYAAAGNCEPSRACLLTGNYTPRHGVFAVNSTSRGSTSEMRLKPIPNANGLVS